MTRRHVSSLANIDLNLLVILRELLREQNVTRAAQRVGITQPAASAALARLRRHFGDELLERTRAGFVLTPLGTRLAAQVEPLCLGLEGLFAPEPPFDPALSTQEFRVLASDYVVVAFGEVLSRALHRVAPEARLHVSVANGRLPDDLPEALRGIDVIISAPKAEFKDEAIRGEEVFRDRWVCVVAADNPVIGDEVTLADLERLPWVVPNQPGDVYPASSPLAPLMAQLTVRPRVAVRVDSYQATPYFVAGTDRVAVMQHRLAEDFADRDDLCILDYPGTPAPIVEVMWWHRRFTEDPAHAWFRQLVVDAGTCLRPAAQARTVFGGTGRDDEDVARPVPDPVA